MAKNNNNFARAAHFFCTFTLVAASISHFLTAAIKFSCYSLNEIDILCFLSSGSSSFSVIHAEVDFRIKSKERIGFVVVVFYLWKSRWLRDLLPKRAGTCSTWNAKFHPGLHEGVDVRTDDFLRTKSFWMHRFTTFLTHRAPLRALLARELRYENAAPSLINDISPLFKTGMKGEVEI